MKKYISIIFFLIFSISGSQRPNILFIIMDDLNDLPSLPAHNRDLATPHMDRIANNGVNFTNAHSNDPICAPSRASMLYGIYPQTSGLIWFESPKQRSVLKNSVDLPGHLSKNGYNVFGTGKIYHGGKNNRAFKSYGVGNNFGPHPINGDSFMGHHSSQDHLFEKFPNLPYKWEQTFGSLNDIPDWSHLEKGKQGWFLYGKPWNLRKGHNRDKLPDEMSADYCSKILKQKHDKPFVLFAGLVRTHTPLYAPQEYFDRFPLSSIKLPKKLKNDLSDCANSISDKSRYGFQRFDFLMQEGNDDLLKRWTQAYLACVAFVDDQIGKILDSLENSEYAKNTIVILTSDHGFHMGEKEFIYKQSLWDRGTKVPLMISGIPGMVEGKKCTQPVSLIDIYPTFVDLCQLPKAPNKGKSNYPLEGFSLKTLALDPKGEWMGPDVAITALPGKDHIMNRQFKGALFPHFSVRSEEWRYTLSSTGEEELYNYRIDPDEFTNLANNPEYFSIKKNLRKKLESLRDGNKWQAIGESPMQKIKNLELEINGYLPEINGVKPKFLPKGKHLWRLRLEGNRMEVWKDGKLFSDETIERNEFLNLNFKGLSSGRIRML